MRASLLAFALVTLAAVSVAPVASAQDHTAEARQHFGRGVAHYEAGRHAQALEEFQQAYQLRSHPAVLVNLANCLLRLGRYPEAVLHFERYLADSTDITADQRSATERALEDARGHVGQIVLSVNPPGARVRVDGRDVGNAPFSRPLVVPTGRHRIEASAAGRGSQTHELEVTPRATAEWTVTLPPAGGTQGTQAPAPPARGVTAPQAGPRPTGVLAVQTAEPGASVQVDGVEVGVTPWEGAVPAGGAVLEVGGWSGPVELAEGQHGQLRITPGASGPDTRMTKVVVGAAVTGGLLLGTVVTGLLALSAQSDFDDIAERIETERPTGAELDRQRQAGRDASDRLSAWSTSSDVFLVCTILAAGGTAAFYFLAAPHEDDATAAFQVGIGPGSARIAGTF